MSTAGTRAAALDVRGRDIEKVDLGRALDSATMQWAIISSALDARLTHMDLHRDHGGDGWR
jgi:hypothetical protein